MSSSSRATAFRKNGFVIRHIAQNSGVSQAGIDLYVQLLYLKYRCHPKQFSRSLLLVSSITVTFLH